MATPPPLGRGRPGDGAAAAGGATAGDGGVQLPAAGQREADGAVPGPGHHPPLYNGPGAAAGAGGDLPPSGRPWLMATPCRGSQQPVSHNRPNSDIFWLRQQERSIPVYNAHTHSTPARAHTQAHSLTQTRLSHFMPPEGCANSLAVKFALTLFLCSFQISSFPIVSQGLGQGF